MRKKKYALLLFFIVYCSTMLWFLFFQRIRPVTPMDYWERIKYSYNLRPGYSIASMIMLIVNRPVLRVFALRNLLGNIIVFIPLGFFLPRLFSVFHRYFRFLFFQIGIFLVIESLQLFTLLGSADIDDLILNTIGASVGFLLWKKLSFNKKG